MYSVSFRSPAYLTDTSMSVCSIVPVRLLVVHMVSSNSLLPKVLIEPGDVA
jgi:hypothetical protein